MSTADHAGRPLTPPAASGGSSFRGPYADGGSAARAKETSGDGSALRRLAEADTTVNTAAPPTTPVPVSPPPTEPLAPTQYTAAPPTTPVPVSPPPSEPAAPTQYTVPPAAAPPASAPPVAPPPPAPAPPAEAPGTGPSWQSPPATGPSWQSPPVTTELPAEPVAPQAAASDPAVVEHRRPQSGPARSRPAPRPGAPRRVRLTVSRVDPWSAMKISFLLSVALGIAGVVMVAVLWTILNGMGVFDQVNGIVGQVVQDGSQRFDILDFVGFGRVVSLSIVIGVIDVILITAIATLAAFLYNVSSALVGGLQLTLSDD